jgi:3-hydroxyisobutyrate dehydrogenase
MMLKTGFIGLGAMGASMARNLHKRALLTHVWNRTAAKAQTLAAELGVVAADYPATLAMSCNAVVLCVSADDDVLATVDALAPALKPGSIVIDCSTVSAATARTAAERLATLGVEFLDAPVSGGTEGARNGTLAIMAGGSESAFMRAKPILDAMGTTVAHFGATGAGQSAKATNQIMCAPNMVRNSYPAGFRVQLHQKDLNICHDMAARHGVQLPVVEMTLLHYRRLIEQGHGDDDISTLFRLKDQLFHKTT